MFEFLSIVCVAVSMMQGGCMPDDLKTQGAKPVEVSDSYERVIAPGAYQLSYSASGYKLDTVALTAHWKRRAAQLCAGKFIGQPVTQTQYPQSGYDATFLSWNRNFNVEAYGVAYCVEHQG